PYEPRALQTGASRRPRSFGSGHALECTPLASLPCVHRSAWFSRPGVVGPAVSRFEDPVIISCSISGVLANREQSPAIPYTPEEYAAEARRAVEEGAAQIHIHARKPDGTPSFEV